MRAIRAYFYPGGGSAKTGFLFRAAPSLYTIKFHDLFYTNTTKNLLKQNKTHNFTKQKLQKHKIKPF